MTAPAPFGLISAKSGHLAKLSMQRLWVTGCILPVGARLSVQHDFRPDEKGPVELIYSFPLPRDAALHRFRITGEGFDTHSELRDRASATDRYERAIAAGSLAAEARQHGDGIVNLTVGNIQPGELVVIHLDLIAGVEARDDGFRFRYPFTLAPAYHPRARVADGVIELPQDEFGDVMLPPLRKDAAGLHEVGFDLTVTGKPDLLEIASPSHAIRVRGEDHTRVRVSLARESDIPNRDLVLDARFGQVRPQIYSGGGQFAALLPSRAFGERAETARRVVVLLDRSGSMEGAPLTQAIRAISACLGALSEADRFGLIAFDDEIEAFGPDLLPATAQNRDSASRFLRQIGARGGTELGQGVSEAVRALAGADGDILILTDGQVSGTETILTQARAAGTRLHCLGIGSASQDRFLSLLARETGGVSRFLTAGERVDIAAVDLFASIGRPVATALKAGAGVEPQPPENVIAGTPVVLYGAGDTALEVSWDGGALTIPLEDADPDLAETLKLLRGARLITDWDSRYPAAEANSAMEKRKASRVAARLLALSEEYGLASREMSLVAVVRRQDDRPGELPETRIIPVGMAQDTEWESCFSLPSPPTYKLRLGAQKARRSSSMELSNLLAHSAEFIGARFDDVETLATAPISQVTPEDQLMELGARMQSDGGMDGGDDDERTTATILALWAFIAHGHTAQSGAFRSHVRRLEDWLERQRNLSPDRLALLGRILELARQGRVPPGNWLTESGWPNPGWKRIESALRKQAVSGGADRSRTGE